MKAIIGLGNPGSTYTNSRHNLGFEVLDHLLAHLQSLNPESSTTFKPHPKFHSHTCTLDQLILVKPQTYMNASGQAVQAITNFYRIHPNSLWVIHDDLDLKLGDYKIQLGKGPKVHGGLNSIEQSLGQSDFWRVRIGIESRGQGSSPPSLTSQVLNFLNRQPTKPSKIPGKQYVLMKLTSPERTQIDTLFNQLIPDIITRIHT